MADAQLAKVNLINRALLKLGLPASYTIDAEDPRAAMCDMAWQGVEAKVSSIYSFTYGRKTSEPAAPADATGSGWQFAFDLPAGRIGDPVAVLDDVKSEHFLRSYKIENGVLYTDVSPVWVTCKYPMDPEVFDAGYAEAFAIALASALAVPMAQDETREKDLRVEAFGRPDQNDGGGLFGKLITVNRAATPQGRGFMADDPLTRARFGGGGWRY